MVNHVLQFPLKRRQFLLCLSFLIGLHIDVLELYVETVTTGVKGVRLRGEGAGENVSSLSQSASQTFTA